MAKILFVFNSLQFSGAELMYIQAARLLQKKGYQLFALATWSDFGACKDKFIENGYTVYQIVMDRSKGIGASIANFRALKQYVQENQIDIIHCQSNSRFKLCAMVAKVCGIRSVHSINNSFRCSSQWKIPVQRFLRWFVSHPLGMRFHSGSDTVYKNEVNYFHNKTNLVYWWYEDYKYIPATEGEKESYRKEIGIPSDSFVLMTAGSCGYQKHHSEIINAVKKMADIIPNFLFMHLGSGELENEEKELAASLGVSNYIRFMGNQSDFRKFLLISDVFCMTSRYEGLSNATIQALACKIPAVLYHVAGLEDYNLEGENTLQVETNPEALAKGVIELYNNGQLRLDLSERGRTLVLKKYSMEKNVNRLIEVLYK